MPKGNNPISKPNKAEAARRSAQLQLALEQAVREAKSLAPVVTGQLRDSIQLVQIDNGYGIIAEDYYSYIASGHGTAAPDPFIDEAIAANLDKIGEAWADGLVEDIIKQLDQFQ
jgi:TolB-like protein